MTLSSPALGGRTVATSASDLATKLKALGPGDHTVGVADGHHDRCAVAGVNTGGTVTIVPENPRGAKFDRLHFGSGCVGITVRGIDGEAKAEVPVVNAKPYIFMAQPGSSKIRFEDTVIKTRSDADGCTRWAKADWWDWQIGGIQIRGADCAVSKADLRAVYFGVDASIGSRRALIEDVTIRGVAGDGFRVNESGTTVRRCKVTDFVRIDANHPDGLQAFGKYDPTTRKYALLSDLTLEDLSFIEWTDWQTNPLRINPDPGMGRYGILQGIGFHSAPYARVAMRRINVATCHANGVKIVGVNGLAIEDVTAWNVDHGTPFDKANLPRIDIKGCTITSMSNLRANAFLNQAKGTPVDYSALPAV